MDFLIITGPQAVGKMAVGMAVAEKTGLKLFHNHMTIELVIRLFDYGSPEGQHLIGTFRNEIFEKKYTPYHPLVPVVVDCYGSETSVLPGLRPDPG